MVSLCVNNCGTHIECNLENVHIVGRHAISSYTCTTHTFKFHSFNPRTWLLQFSFFVFFCHLYSIFRAQLNECKEENEYVSMIFAYVKVCLQQIFLNIHKQCLLLLLFGCNLVMLAAMHFMSSNILLRWAICQRCPHRKITTIK